MPSARFLASPILLGAVRACGMCQSTKGTQALAVFRSASLGLELLALAEHAHDAVGVAAGLELARADALGAGLGRDHGQDPADVRIQSSVIPSYTSVSSKPSQTLCQTQRWKR